MTQGQSDQRSLLIASLQDFAAYLEAHPDVPAPYSVDVMVFPLRDSDAAMCAEIDRIAALIGCEVVDQRADFGHYDAARSFGPVTYTAVAILADARARHDALMSYRDSVVPDIPTARHAMDQR